VLPRGIAAIASPAAGGGGVESRRLLDAGSLVGLAAGSWGQPCIALGGCPDVAAIGGAYGWGMPVPIPLALTAAAMCAAVIAGCGGSSKAGPGPANVHPIVLHMSNQLEDQQPLEIYARQVDRLTHGAVRIDVGSNAYRGQPDAEQRIVADVRDGRAQMGWVGSRVLDALGDHLFAPLTAPLLIDSYALEQRVMEQPALIGPMVGSLRSLGVVGLGVLPGVMRRVLGINGPIRRPEDLHGQVVGIAKSDLSAQSVRALGAVPRTLGPMAPDTGLSALESQLDAIYGNLYFTQMSAVTADLALWPRPLVLIVNPSVFARLTGEERSALRDAARQVVPQFTAWARADDAAGLRGLCRAHVAFVRADLPAFRAALRPVYDGLPHAPVAQIESLRRGTTGDPALSCGATHGSAGRVRAVLDGVFGKTITPGQAHSDVPENFGTFVRVFDHGRFALTQHSPKSCYWAYGRYVLDGSRITFINRDGGGITPTNAGAKPGETVSLRWRLFRDELSLTAPDNPDPGAYHRISATPSSGYLDKACPPPAGWDR